MAVRRRHVRRTRKGLVMVRQHRLSPKARLFIARKIRRNIREGKRPRQAVAIAFSQARKEGFRVSKASGR
mgnify:CR=1 FL=1